jgi:hypothetical protein
MRREVWGAGRAAARAPAAGSLATGMQESA